MSDSDPYAAITTAAASIGIAPPPFPLRVDAGVIRYCDHQNDRPGTTNAWYVAISNPDGTTGGSVGSWKALLSAPWCTSTTHVFTTAERAEFARKQAEAKAQAEAERLRLAEETAAKAARLWQKARQLDPAHPYVTRKGTHTHRARQLGNSIVLDYRDLSGKITTLQFIDSSGGKKFLKDGIVSGSSHRFGPKITDVVILAEGFATGATLHEATGHPVAVCGFAGNIGSVAVGIRQKYPAINIIIAGDADPVGKAAAEAAAELVNGVVCLPDFTGEGGNDGR